MIISLFGTACQTSFAKFIFIHRPHGAFDIFYTHETFVQGEIVSYGILEKNERFSKELKSEVEELTFQV